MMNLQEDARKCAEMIQERLINRLETSDESCLVLMSVHSFVGYIGRELANKNIGDEFSGEEFLHVMRRACTKMANELKKKVEH